MNLKKGRILKISLLVLVILLTIIVGTGIYLGSRWKRIVQAQLEEKTYQMSDGFYKIKIGEMRVEILRRRIVIENIALYPDSVVFARLQSAGSLPPFFVNIKLNAIDVQDVRYTKDGRGHKLGLRKFRIDDPRISVTRTGHKKDQPDRDTLPKNLYQLISPALSSVNVREVDISNGSFHYTEWKPGDTARYHVDNFELHARQFLVDSTAGARKEKLYCDDIKFAVDTFSYVLPNGLFAASFNRVEIGLADSSLVFNDLKLIPQYDKSHFAIKNPKHTNWMELGIGRMTCTGVDCRRLLSQKAIDIDSISITDVLYTNMKNRVVEQAPIVKPMLYEYVQKAPWPLHIRIIHLQDATVVYEDLPKEKDIPGTITFGKMEGDFYNVTNIITGKNQYMTVKAKAYIQDEGILRATFRFPVDPHNNHFEIKGNLGQMHLVRLNPMFEPFLVSVKNGVSERIDFSINGNDQQAHLDMVFRYNDLHVSLLKEKNNHLVRRAIISDIANGMILFNDNPDEGQEPRRAQTITQRNVYRASFHYFWHTLMDGLKESIGITNKREKQLKWFRQEARKIHIIKEE